MGVCTMKAAVWSTLKYGFCKQTAGLPWKEGDRVHRDKITGGRIPEIELVSFYR
jgi:hypothetical protein